jgi:hypothetical protein
MEEDKIHIKLVECMTSLCQLQANSALRNAILENRSIFNKAQRYLMEALLNDCKEEALSYLQLFLVVCSG